MTRSVQETCKRELNVPSRDQYSDALILWHENVNGLVDHISYLSALTRKQLSFKLLHPTRCIIQLFLSLLQKQLLSIPCNLSGGDSPSVKREVCSTYIHSNSPGVLLQLCPCLCDLWNSQCHPPSAHTLAVRNVSR